jgi:hypothetical protein
MDYTVSILPRETINTLGWKVVFLPLEMDSVKVAYGTFFGAHISKSSFKKVAEFHPDVLVAQATSQDYGPHYQCTGTTMFSSQGDKEIIRQFVLAALDMDVPFIFSLGTAGSDAGLEGDLRLVDEILREEKRKMRVAVISGEIDKAYVLKQIKQGKKITRLAIHPRFSENLTVKDVQEAINIIGQMGPEPIMQYIDMIDKKEIDGIITGRALDVGLLMAYPLKRGFSRDVVAHMGKSMENGAMATELVEGLPPETTGVSHELVCAEVYKDHFLIRPFNPALRCTPQSVTLETFYERGNPTMERMPGGHLDLSRARYEQYDERTVKAYGGKWIPSEYSIKIEAGKMIGYRTINVLGVRDPTVIERIGQLTESVSKETKEVIPPEKWGNYTLLFHIFGKNAVLGPLETVQEIRGHEICVIIDVIADTQQLASHVVGAADRFLLFKKGMMSTGDISVPFGPQIMELGSSYIWNIWHRMEVDDPHEPFRSVAPMEFPRKQTDLIPFYKGFRSIG